MIYEENIYREINKHELFCMVTKNGTMIYIKNS